MHHFEQKYRLKATSRKFRFFQIEIWYERKPSNSGSWPWLMMTMYKSMCVPLGAIWDPFAIVNFITLISTIGLEKEKIKKKTRKTRVWKPKKKIQLARKFCCSSGVKGGKSTVWIKIQLYHINHSYEIHTFLIWNSILPTHHQYHLNTNLPN